MHCSIKAWTELSSWNIFNLRQLFNKVDEADEAIFHKNGSSAVLKIYCIVNSTFMFPPGKKRHGLKHTLINMSVVYCWGWVKFSRRKKLFIQCQKVTVACKIWATIILDHNVFAILNGLKLNIVPGREETRSLSEGNSSCFQPVMEKGMKKIAERITTMNHEIHPPHPGPLECFSAPRHQILATSAPQKTRNCDKAEFATKVRKSN